MTMSLSASPNIFDVCMRRLEKNIDIYCVAQYSRKILQYYANAIYI